MRRLGAVSHEERDKRRTRSRSAGPRSSWAHMSTREKVMEASASSLLEKKNSSRLEKKNSSRPPTWGC